MDKENKIREVRSFSGFALEEHAAKAHSRARNTEAHLDASAKILTLIPEIKCSVEAVFSS